MTSLVVLILLVLGAALWFGLLRKRLNGDATRPTSSDSGGGEFFESHSDHSSSGSDGGGGDGGGD